MLLEGSETGTSLLRALFESARTAFPDDFASLTLPSEDAGFKARFAELVPQFEALRVVSARRAEIARALCLSALSRLRFVDAQGARPLSDAVAEPSAALPLVRVALPGAGTLLPSVDFRGHLYEGAQVGALADELFEARLATRAARDALERVASTRGLSLAGERFVLIGAGAELSPVYALLEAGAEVLWLDLRNPPIDHLLEPRLAGALSYVERGADVLAQPAAMRATIERFADGRPVHIGLYAFAGGAARELRLDFTSLAIVRALPASLLRSVALLLSPTSASPISREDAERADQRKQSAGTVQRALLRAGPLSTGHLAAGERRLSCAVVTQQGTSYQVAEYVGKRLAAEALFSYGSDLGEEAAAPLAVSANMAPITATSSLASPLLEAALLGAESLDMLIAQPSTSRAISALLTIHDALHASASAAHAAQAEPSAALDALFARQFHGGVHAQPYALEGLIRMAALRGLTQRPKLALELLR